MNKIAFLLSFIVLLISCNTNNNESNIKKISVNELKLTIHNSDIQLIDVRTKKEYDNGHIANAKLIDYFSDDFKNQLLKLNKDIPVYVYCKSGNRSGKASKMLNELGFNQIFDLEGGYSKWSKETE
ncbi:rhodanese-like domain-containing protein [Tenacibaculum sp. M341]|uniref:rhodanese-like domain-containing protein n=1 Tax=Tenacibaculum sp. M341 TaxID=2530339 RepID=UPI00104C9BF5|nr:rhodanese-like domain-containing protein [Tenacibaculum sp. M341]TCI90993.1 rhodanese-like domain-containing protein [Tenacibaculum sp. M341]